MRIADASRVVTSAMRAAGHDGDYLAHMQERRLSTLLRHARVRSPYFRALLRDLPDEIDDLSMVPPTAKSELMSHFDDWVTDPRLRYDRLHREFLAKPELVGHTYLNQYRIFTTSGTTGAPAVIIHDPTSWLVFQLISRMRARRQMLRHGLMRGVFRGGMRSAVLFATGGHYGGAGVAAFVQHLHPALSRRVRVISVLRPLHSQVAELNEYQPTFVSGYPSALLALATEQQEGRLSIAPSVMLCAGEHLSEGQRRAIEESFSCHLLQGYAASEVPALALECDEHRFHINSDWYLLEPIDAGGNPVPAGTASDSCLVTNLSNFVQPIVRYDLGDRVRMYADRCRCGSDLPSLDVEGRTNDLVTLATKDGSSAKIVPLALGAVIEETPGVRRFQVLNPDDRTLLVRLDETTGADRARVWERLENRLGHFMADQGVTGVDIRLASQRPEAEPGGGKLRQVIRGSAAASAG